MCVLYVVVCCRVVECCVVLCCVANTTNTTPRHTATQHNNGVPLIHTFFMEDMAARLRTKARSLGVCCVGCLVGCMRCCVVLCCVVLCCCCVVLCVALLCCCCVELRCVVGVRCAYACFACTCTLLSVCHYPHQGGVVM